ncbi:MAG: glycosyltransferase [bacterium]|jgi:4-amino-4-deoxy-L-arabinose transferase|nr:glycosyltransferase [bacterium]
MPPAEIPNISIVIPVKNESETIDSLAHEITSILAGESWSWECMWIDDASSDTTKLTLQFLHKNDPRHRFLSLTENVGQSAALWIGFQKTRGQIIVTLDGDGQNDPADIPALVRLVLNGETDMANGYRQHRQDTTFRRIISKVANSTRNAITGPTVRDVGCAIRAFRRDCVSTFPSFAGMHRFLPTFALNAGYRITEIPVHHRPRLNGRSSYTLFNRLWVGLYDLFGVQWLTKRSFLPALQAALSPRPSDFGTQAENDLIPFWRHAPFWLCMGLSLFIALLFVDRGLFESTEGRYAECAREMLVQQNYLEPTLNFESHWTKPPMTYWAIAAGMTLLGQHELGIRLYLILAFISTTALAYALGHILWGRAVAPFGALVYCTSLFTASTSNVVSTDVLLTFWQALAVTAFWAGFKQERPWSYILMWSALGAAFLTKGPPGLLCLTGILPTYFLARYYGKPGPSLFSFTGLTLFALIGFSWYIAEGIHHPGLLQYWFSEEMINRVLTAEHHRNSEWYKILTVYGPILLFGSMPWSLILLVHRPKIWKQIHAKLNRFQLTDNYHWVFFGLSITIPVLIFSLSQSRLHLYLLPLFLSLSVILGRLVHEHCISSQYSRGNFIMILVGAVLLAGTAKTAPLLREDHLSMKDDSLAVHTLIQQIPGSKTFFYYGDRIPYGLEFYLKEPFQQIAKDDNQDLHLVEPRDLRQILTDCQTKQSLPIIVLNASHQEQFLEFCQSIPEEGWIWDGKTFKTTTSHPIQSRWLPHYYALIIH